LGTYGAWQCWTWAVTGCARRNGAPTSRTPLGAHREHPGELGRCTALSVLKLQQNRLKGSVPSTLSSLVRLRDLDLSYNNFTGPFPLGGHLRGLRTLTSLNLQTNAFQGPLPKDISALSRLTNLNLQYLPTFGGTLPSELGAMPALQSLTLDTLAVTGSMPEALSGLAALSFLKLNDLPGLAGPIPRWLSTMANLAYLSISSTGVSGTLPASLGTQLTSLRLAGNQLSGDIPCARQRTQAEAVEPRTCRATSVSGPIPTAWRGPSPGVHQAEQQLPRGPLPPLLFTSLVSLYQFEVSNNKLSGTVPSALLRLLPLISALDISYNGLSGTAPEVVCSSGALSKVWMQGNVLTGDVEAILGPEVKTCAANTGSAAGLVKQHALRYAPAPPAGSQQPRLPQPPGQQHLGPRSNSGGRFLLLPQHPQARQQRPHGPHPRRALPLLLLPPVPRPLGECAVRRNAAPETTNMQEEVEGVHGGSQGVPGARQTVQEVGAMPAFHP